MSLCLVIMPPPSEIFLGQVSEVIAYESRYGTGQMDIPITWFFTSGRFPNHSKPVIFSHKYTYLTCRDIVVFKLIIYIKVLSVLPSMKPIFS